MEQLEHPVITAMQRYGYAPRRRARLRCRLCGAAVGREYYALDARVYCSACVQWARRTEGDDADG